MHQVKEGVLPPQISELHEFQVLVKRTGYDARGKRLDWGARPITLEELKALKEAFEKIVERLDAAIEGLDA